MISIVDARGTGKSKQLIEAAQKANAIILTKDKRGFEVKAKQYGFEDVDILDYEDLENDDYTLARPIMIHEVNYALDYLFDRYYGLKVEGYSGTKENDNKKQKSTNRTAKASK